LNFGSIDNVIAHGGAIAQLFPLARMLFAPKADTQRMRRRVSLKRRTSVLIGSFDNKQWSPSLVAAAVGNTWRGTA